MSSWSRHCIQPCWVRDLTLLGLLFFSCSAVWSEDSPGFRFLENYCLDCHDDLSEKGDRSFEKIAFPLKSLSDLIEAQEIVDQLNLEAMPPAKADQPTPEERAEAIAYFSQEIFKARETLRSTGRQTVLRRLNEREYIQTVEDLFQRRTDTFAPTDRFPTDQTWHHIDTIGDELVTSGFLLHNYFQAAGRIVEKSLGMKEKPEERSWHFKDHFYQGQELSYSHKKVYNYRYLCIYEVPNTVNHEGGYGGLEAFKEGVHADGIYSVQVLAHSVNRDTPYDPSIFRMNFDEPFRLGIVTGDALAGKLHHPQPIEPKLAEVVVQDGKPQWYQMEVWLEKGQQPRFIFPNGMANCRNAFSTIANRYKKEWPEGDAYLEGGGIVQARRVVLEHGKMPHIRIHEVKIDGPIYKEWPPPRYQLLLGNRNEDDFGAAEHREQILREFASRAYRRPPKGQEVQALVSVAEQRIKKGHPPRQGILDAMKAALCSPAFLYLDEAVGQEGGKLDAHDLAARLSYFLTSSMPDAELRRLADSGELLEEEVLLAESQRLLASEGSEEFYSGFLDSWLNLRALGGMPPDRSASAPYYYDDLENAMKQEVHHFFRYLVEKNLPARELIRSDFTFVNHSLATLYQIPFPYPQSERYEFQKVMLGEKAKRRRGGLLGMGAVLTVSANGIETSPVTRGVYVLENLLGTPTPPPPDEVPLIEPDTRGTSTIRDQLEKHREAKTCAECHRKIDPPGFALENFDPIGRWRSNYPPASKRKPGKAIDATGEFVGGKEFRNIDEFRTLLLDQEDFIVRHLIETLLAYATGRSMEALDRVDIEILKEKARSEDRSYRLGDILNQVVASEIFRNR